MRGRKPTPTVLRVLRHNPSRRPYNLEEPTPDPLAIACPQELPDSTARAEWDRTIVPAITRGQIADADRVLAIAHCELFGTWLSQRAEAAKHPHVVAVGPQKYPVPNPARGMANKTLMLLVKVDAELGFSPTSRSRVQVKGPSTLTRLDRQRAEFAGMTRG